jgi:hypothetical protein
MEQKSSAPVAVTTAGLRGAYWSSERMPADVVMTAHALKTEDGSNVVGYLFRRGGERAVVCAMHPREMLVTQYMIPEVLRGGCAMWVQGPRTVGNDIRLEHESALLDLAAGQKFLVEQGYAKRVLLGTSGGGPLACFYIQQAMLAPAARLKHSPAGKPTDLESAMLPVPDGLILVSAHLGQGKLLLAGIDPSVVDENDALAVDETLSAFSAKNGFKRPPESSRYAADFLERYRAAQLKRVERIDAFAKAIVERKAAARKRNKEAPNRADSILAAHSPIFTVWRTDADPRCFDLSLDPSDRAYGTLWGANPFVANYGSVGFARVCTAESWLSNWSALSSNATMEKCAPSLRQPTLMIEYTGDNSVFPADADKLFGLIGSNDKVRHRVHGNHQGQAIRKEMPNGQLVAGELVRGWLAEKGFPQ